MALSKLAREFMVDGLTSEPIANEICDAIDASSASQWPANYEVKTLKLVLTPTQLADTSAIPISVIPAPGANKFIALIQCVAQMTGVASTPWAGGSNFGVYDTQYMGAALIPLGSFIAATSDSIGVVGNNTLLSKLNNSFIVTCTADPTGGLGSLTLHIAYAIIST